MSTYNRRMSSVRLVHLEVTRSSHTVAEDCRLWVSPAPPISGTESAGASSSSNPRSLTHVDINQGIAELYQLFGLEIGG